MSALPDMGGYGAFIWPAYAVTILGLGGAIVWVLNGWRCAKARLAALDAARSGRAEETI